MKARSPVRAVLALLAFLGALYSLSGVVMDIQFALAARNVAYARAALVWGVVALLCLAAAVVLGRAAWKHRRGQAA